MGYVFAHETYVSLHDKKQVPRPSAVPHCARRDGLSARQATEAVGGRPKILEENRPIAQNRAVSGLGQYAERKRLQPGGPNQGAAKLILRAIESWHLVC